MTLAQLVAESYAVRPCWSCERLGPCGHRDYDVEVAIIAAHYAAELRLEGRKPIAKATAAEQPAAFIEVEYAS